MPFILKKRPVTDPVLGRLAISRNGLMPVRYRQGWALRDDIRHSWKRLERGLLFIATTLILHNNTAIGKTISGLRCWREPAEFGYLEMHQGQETAFHCARRSQEAFAFLAARCSLAIALWTPPPSDKQPGAPNWVTFLHNQGVHYSWTDILRSSIITDFSLGLRVGCVIDAQKFTWSAIIPYLLRAKVPVFVWWANDQVVEPICAKKKELKPLRPETGDGLRAAHTPVSESSGNQYTLWCKGRKRFHPVHSHTGCPIPCGPFQNPGESREQFFWRMDKIAPEKDIDPSTVRRFHQCMTLGYPLPGARVYTWRKIGQVFPDCPIEFRDWDFREPIPNHSFSVTFGIKRNQYNFAYNAYYDMWDLWDKEDSGYEANMEFPTDHLSTSSQPTDLADSIEPSNNDNTASQRLDKVLIGTHLVEYEMEFSSNFIEEWYGLHPRYCEDTLPDYTRFPAIRIHTVFGLRKEEMHESDDYMKAMSGWAWCLLNHKYSSRTMKDCWDLNAKHPLYIMRDPIDHMVIRSAGYAEGVGHKLYTVRYTKDVPSMTWILLVNAVVLVRLIRFRTIHDSVSAIQHLIMTGCAFYTIQDAKEVPQRVEHKAYNPIAVYRPSTHRPTTTEYTEQHMRIMDLLQHPHARAALMRGGIIWRIMMEMLGQNSHLWESMMDEVCNGPSGSCDHKFTIESYALGGKYVDDDLSVEELDLISGVVKVYTGNTNPSPTCIRR